MFGVDPVLLLKRTAKRKLGVPVAVFGGEDIDVDFLPNFQAVDIVRSQHLQLAPGDHPL